MKLSMFIFLGVITFGCDSLKSPPNKTAENDDYRCDLIPEKTSTFATRAGFTLTCEAKKQTIRLTNLEINVTERVKVQINKSTRKTEVMGVTRPNDSEPITIKPGKPYTVTGDVGMKRLASITGGGTGRTMNVRAKIIYPTDKRPMEEIEKEREANRSKYHISISKAF